MVPAAYVALEALPLTPNGKLDRKALPPPDDEAFARAVYEPPQGEVEETLAAIWADLLGLDRVGRHDNFFELGGHSLLAVQLIERMRRLGLQADVRALFATSRRSAGPGRHARQRQRHRGPAQPDPGRLRRRSRRRCCR